MATSSVTTTAAQAYARSHQGLWWRIRRNGFAYAMIGPAVIAMVLVHLIPTVQAIYMSFLDLRVRTLKQFLGAPFIGLNNYIDIFKDSSPLSFGLGDAARNTFFYAIVVNIGTIGIGLGAALLINREFAGRGIIRTLLLMPWIVPTYVVGLVWGFMWRQDTGAVNSLLVALGLTDHQHAPFWLIGPNTFWAITIPTVWRSFPFTMVLLLSGLQVIPADLYEAAKIDGANGLASFRHITLPLLKPVFSIVILWGVIGSVYAYNIVAVMFGNGAGYPGANADLLQVLLQRQTFLNYAFGSGAAVSVLMMIAMLIFVGIWYSVFRQSLNTQPKDS